MTSRRRLLASIGSVGVAGLAGCGGMSFWGDRNGRRDDVNLSVDDVGTVSWPASPYPVAIPARLPATHRERARQLLDVVPSDPDIPNEAIAAELRSERERVAADLEAGVDEPWPTETLATWRQQREAAASVVGAYRAATGEDDGSELNAQEEAVRDALGSFVADHEYRASSTIEAVLAHAPVEQLIEDCRRASRPDPTYPAEPIDRPFHAGDVVGRIETAGTTLTDAARLRSTYISERDETPSQWTELIAAADRLDIAVSRTRSIVRDFLREEEPPFIADLEGTPARTLFRRASGHVEAVSEDHWDHRADGDYARAVIEAGQVLAGVEALRAAIAGIRESDAYEGAVTADSVAQTADRAREAIGAIDESDDGRVAAALAQPALGTFAYMSTHIEEGYADPARVEGTLAWAELYARAVPAAADFVIERL